MINNTSVDLGTNVEHQSVAFEISCNQLPSDSLFGLLCGFLSPGQMVLNGFVSTIILLKYVILSHLVVFKV